MFVYGKGVLLQRIQSGGTVRVIPNIEKVFDSFTKRKVINLRKFLFNCLFCFVIISVYTLLLGIDVMNIVVK